VNNETNYALNLWGLDVPAPFLDVKAEYPDKKVCIVDHNQAKQCPDGLEMEQLLGCIDHHAMQGGTISTSTPIYVNIQPWGSACTIVAHMYFRSRRKLPRAIAGILVSGILSDTLNLRSPTTTEHDCLAVSLLSKLAQVDDINQLARNLFKAKAMELLRCTPHQLVRGDLKTFECHCTNPHAPKAAKQLITMAFGVIETTDCAGLVEIRDDLRYELRALKKEEKKDLAFVAFVDIVNLNTHLLLVGAREQDLAKRVFGGPIDPETGLMALGNRVSRKKEFIPPIEALLSQSGWEMPTLPADEAELEQSELYGEVALECGEHGCQLVRHPPNHDKALTATGLTRRLYAALNMANYEDVQSAVAFALGDTPTPSGTAAAASRKRRVSASAALPENKKEKVGNSTASADAPMTPVGSPALSSVSTAACPSTPHMHHMDASALDQSEAAIRALLDTEDMATAATTINKNFILPTQAQFKQCLKKAVDTNDPALKFLVLALAHSFEKEAEPSDLSAQDCKTD
jgi:manganese-dependent inorganic pyrophosphatase